jgi:hypothetical protein
MSTTHSHREVYNLSACGTCLCAIAPYKGVGPQEAFLTQFCD